MEVLGLTGGIACGKSAVAALMRARGVPVVDADVVARDVVAPGTDGLSEVVARFGEGVLLPDGALDRKALGARVFGDEPARLALNAILHPRIAVESALRLTALAGEGHGFALYEAALLVENGSHKGFTGLIVVTASPEVQLARLIAREGISEDEAKARVASQWPLWKKVAEADWVVDNSGDREALRERVDALYATLVVAYGPPARSAA
ncbi:MAG: dephospho-CoA kinase [Polyangiales bacterium]